MQKLPNYLRKHRKTFGMSQNDIAFLLSCDSSAKVSRHERFNRQPSLLAAFAYEAIFNVSASELFSGVFETVANKIAPRAVLLSQKLEAEGRLLPHVKAILSAIAEKGR